MWTPTTRQQHSRTVIRYQTDLTDAEWRVIAPHLPTPRAMGRPREWPTREITNGIFYVMRTGCPWRLVPSDLPPWGTIYRWFAAWRDDGRFERIVMADGPRGRRRRKFLWTTCCPAGWIHYMLKDRQKSAFDGFVDCIIIEFFHNPITDA